jgi:hypothetical protein
MDFSSYPNYSRYRTLQLVSPNMRGYDVYALQTALKEMGYDTGGLDGIFGPASDRAVKLAQNKLSLVVDGKVGGNTQTAIVKRLANRARELNHLPKGLVFGQCMHESSCRLGNYSEARHDGSYDAGVAQRNSNFHDLADAFDVEDSIELLGRHLAAHYMLYDGVTDLRRRWELASGSWNAPAFTNWIANDEGDAVVPKSKPSWWPAELVFVGQSKPGPLAREKIEAYMKSATAFLEL